jgi:hypothetical protein
MLTDDPVIRCVLAGWIEPVGVDDVGYAILRLTPAGRAVLVAGPATCSCHRTLRAVREGTTMDRVIWVHLPWATFGLVARDGIVVQAAPVARYAEGWTVERALRYFAGRGATIQEAQG